MTTTIAPTPPHLIKGGRIAFLHSNGPVLLFAGGGSQAPYALPVRLSAPVTDGARFTLQPKVISAEQQQVQQPTVVVNDAGVTETLPSTQQRREILKRRIQQRPSQEHLIRKNILLTDNRVEPFVREKANQLRKQSVVSNLNRKLRSRPGPCDLITQKILKADEELEKALRDGTLSFPSSRRDNLYAVPSPSPGTPQAPSPSVLLSTLRISRQESLREEQESGKSRVEENTSQEKIGVEMDDDDYHCDGQSSKKIRKKHPYRIEAHHQPSPLRKMKTPEYKRGLDYTTSSEDGSPSISNYDRLIQQQRIVLEWDEKCDDRKSREGSESDSGETIPYGESSPKTYRIAIPDSQQQHMNSVPSTKTLILNPIKPQVTRPQSAQYRPPVQRLADLKVAELKEECKLRGMSLSGTKGQLVDKLTAFEQEIVVKYAAIVSRTKEEMSASMGNSDSPTHNSIQNSSSSASPITIIDDRPYDDGIIHIDESIQSRRHSLPTNNHPAKIIQGTRHLSISSTTHSNGQSIPQQHQQPIQLQPVHQIQQISTNRQVQLVASDGQIVYATLREGELPIRADGRPIQCKISINQGQATIQAMEKPMPTPPPVPPVTFPDTFTFTANGCGGQVTRIPSSDSSHPPQMNLLPIKTTQSSSRPSQFSSNQTKSSTASLSSQPVQITIRGVPVQQEPSRVIPTSTSSVSSSSSFVEQTRYVQEEQGAGNTQVLNIRKMVTTGRSPPVADQPNESPDLPPPPSSEQKTTPSNEDPQLEPIENVIADLNEILTESGGQKYDMMSLKMDEQTIARHAELMKNHQRKINALQRELKRSQAILRHDHQLITSAKRAQSKKISDRTNGQIDNAIDAWLLQLDVKAFNKCNMQFFLNHKHQMCEQEAIQIENRRLEREESQQQREEHSIHALKDILRFLRGRVDNSLLLVQLLYKYQQERAQQESEEKKEPVNVPPTTETMPPSGGEFTVLSKPGTTLQAEKVLQQKQALRAQAKATARIVPHSSSTRNRQSAQTQPPVVVICDDDEERVVHPKEDGELQNEQEYEPRRVDMEEIFKTVLERNKNITDTPVQSVSNISAISPSLSSASSIHSSHRAHTPPSNNDNMNISNNDIAMANTDMNISHNDMSIPTIVTGYIKNNNFVVSQHGDVHMDTGYTIQENKNNIQRQYVHTTDILMEAVESSGIVDESTIMLIHDNSTPIDCTNNNADMMAVETELHGVEPTYPPIDGSDFDDLMDILISDQNQRPSPDSKKPMQYNGTEELTAVLGSSWMEEVPVDGQSTSSTMHQSPNVSTSTNEDVFNMVDDDQLGESFNGIDYREGLSPIMNQEDEHWLDHDADMDFGGMNPFSFSTLNT